ncbi:F-type H+-transporting ATPase subunit b [Faunimonas pinastri]|uniref:ATP synthase subunit b n=1 Tax=Faunimonas pinastri TaxID=1855383 RepID=A0A1H8ZRU1_9HYPH|nr:F0F1 ATP synthase subunit B [Faunimonas pinastri]SEP67186.1 F-type H+-transporting ATPase subunit b [Faunimonas pinastri]
METSTNTEPGAVPGNTTAAPVTHESTAAEAGHHAAFPPFDASTFPSQILWLVITFIALYIVMSRVALPRVGKVIEDRQDRLQKDFAEAARLKQESDAAVAAYEQSLADARRRAQTIAQEARDQAKAASEADRKRAEGDLAGRLEVAEARIAEIKGRALGDVDAIARDATEALVSVLIGGNITAEEAKRAVASSAAKGSGA